MEIKDLDKLSSVFASPKRLILLHLLSKEPMGHMNIQKAFGENQIPIGASEVYKHLRLLRDNDLIVWRNRKYIITSKGMVFLESLDKIIKTEARLPKVEMKF